MQHELLSRSRCCTRVTGYRKRGSAMIRTWHLVPRTPPQGAVVAFAQGSNPAPGCSGGAGLLVADRAV